MLFIRRSLVLASMTLTARAAANPLPAQAAPTVSSKAAMASQLREGTVIRMASGRGGVVEGRFARLGNDSLVYQSKDKQDVFLIPLAEIDTLWIQSWDHGKGFRSGALVGGVLGGAGIGLFAASIAHGTNERCNCTDVIVSTVGVGALLGGMIGGALGVSTWRRRWPQ